MISSWTSHLIITPILLPLLVSAIMFLFEERRLRFKRLLALTTSLLLILNAALLLVMTTQPDIDGIVRPLVYLPGNWAAPFGIALVADRLSAMMVMLSAVLGTVALTYSMAQWDKIDPRFHAIFLLIMMGVNGAFLTGDLFNLFVFFEVMLAASYALALHGGGAARTKAGLHYIAMNVATSLFFLIGVALIYSVTGTLNMADIAMQIPKVRSEDLLLLQAGASILGIAFLVKSAMWPLSFWLPSTYANAAAPIAAYFAILSKVGIYTILRLSSLLFGSDAGRATHFADTWLYAGGIATILFGTLGVLAARRMARFASYYVIISSGTLLTAIGTANTGVLAGALFYMISSTIAVAALYLLVEPIERSQNKEELPRPVPEPVFEDQYLALREAEAEEEDEIGEPFPATVALLGGGFAICALVLSGLPPLSGFMAKFAIIDGLLREGQSITAWNWVFIASVIISGIAVLLASTRAGIEMIWAHESKEIPQLSFLEGAPIALLLAICLGLMVMAGSVMRFTENTVHALNQRDLYAEAVLGKSLNVIEEAPAREEGDVK